MSDGQTTAPAIPELPDERVTRSLLRYLEHPSGRRFALVTLDNGLDHTKPNTFGPGGLRALDAALAEAFAGDADAVAVTGKPFWFLAGFDLTVVKQARRGDPARALPEYGHQVFRRLGEGGKPSFALVNGAAIGGGLELALHCTYRTVASGVPAVALSETFLGLVPGWGGSYLLPNLVGAAKALDVIIRNPLANNRMLKGPDAYRMGIFDAMFEPADFLERSLDWAAQVLDGEMVVERPQPERGAAWDGAVAEARAFVESRLHGAAPAPYAALDLVALAKTAGRDDAFNAEDDVVARLAMTDELRAGLYAFDLTQKRAKRPAGAPDRSLARPVATVGIVGAGLMASQMALLFARRLEVPVVMTDLDQDRVDKGLAYVRGEIDKLLAKGRVSPDKANRLRSLVSGSVSKEAFTSADFVIEAVFERMDVKQQVFAEVEAVVKPDAVLATNTSSLSVGEMASRLEHPERVVGFHFFNPVAFMPLLEVVRSRRTDDPTLATAFQVASTLRKTAILVDDSPAFVVNRLLGRWMGEVSRIVDEGTPIEVADRAFEPLGLPMQPFVLLGLVGPAVALHTAETLNAAFPDRFYVSENLRRMVEAGKTSVYTWETGSPVVDPEVAALFSPPAEPVVRDEDGVRSVVLAGIAQEIRTMLDDGVVAAPEDVDLAMIMGAGWPFWNGGITPYLDRTGIAERATGRRFLPPGVADVAG